MVAKGFLGLLRPRHWHHFPDQSCWLLHRLRQQVWPNKDEENGCHELAGWCWMSMDVWCHEHFQFFLRGRAVLALRKWFLAEGPSASGIVLCNSSETCCNSVVQQMWCKACEGEAGAMLITKKCFAQFEVNDRYVVECWSNHLWYRPYTSDAVNPCYEGWDLECHLGISLKAAFQSAISWQYRRTSISHY